MIGMLHLWQQDILIHHTECKKIKGMLKLWQQVVLIQHTEDRSKLLTQMACGGITTVIDQ
jgi:hypothetical protein